MSFPRDWKVPIGVLIAILAANLHWSSKTTIGPSLSDQNAPYKAPLQPEDVDPRDMDPVSYLVYLTPAHTLQKHSEAIGRDIMPYIRSILDLPYYTERGQVVFSYDRVDDEMLDDIRSDRGVELVEYNGWKQKDLLQEGDGE